MVARGRRLQPRAGEKGGSATGPSPVDRARNGSKHHLLVDATGIPLAFSVTGGNRNDITQLIPLLDAVPAVGGLSGRPRRRPDSVIADRAYSHDKRGSTALEGRVRHPMRSAAAVYLWARDEATPFFGAFVKLQVALYRASGGRLAGGSRRAYRCCF